MKRVIAFIFMLCTLYIMDAQPIKPTYEMGVKTYNPPVYVNTNTAIPGPRGPKGYDGKSQVIRLTDTIKVIPDLSQYMRKDDFDDILGRNFGNVFNEQTNIYNSFAMLDSVYAQRFMISDLNLRAHQLKNAGTFKILSGLGLQVISLGLLAYSDIDIVTNANAVITYTIPYVIKEYELDKYLNKNPRDKCGNIYGDEYSYSLSYDEVKKTTTVTTNDNFPCIIERNKLPYQISAGVLAGAGIVLEVLGILDLHDAHVLVNHNSAGVILSF